MERKIVQIATSSDAENGQITLALANDGTLWEGYPRHQGPNANPRYIWEWSQIQQLPQE